MATSLGENSRIIFGYYAHFSNRKGDTQGASIEVILSLYIGFINSKDTIYCVCLGSTPREKLHDRDWRFKIPCGRLDG